ncbi:PIN/TRAM domain-containing protein [Lactococcus termiticola]|uniref:Twitching motility protein pilT n=1 Tax=Lactococcus termiticola TaxID=2169526 RepID=A0A2R5HEQ7_9LACT|nr:PIN/TRAM domain-containing protein [Lactococcus termiticola]GBG96522.1 twitching motility protein pilT [Lactococcus termiticola]
MRRWMIHLVMAIVGASIGIAVLPDFWHLVGFHSGLTSHNVFNGFVGAIILFVLSFLFVATLLLALFKRIDQKISKVELSSLVFNLIGAIIGLVLGVLISIPLSLLHIPLLTNILAFILIVGLTYLGYMLFHRRGDEIFRLLSRKRRETMELVDEEVVTTTKAEPTAYVVSPLVVDTSTIIDGRIYDVLKTGFISERLIIPDFVLLELQLISDSSDPLKRAKGRRGLDLVTKLKDFENVEISDKDYPEIKEVDTKLLRFASEEGAKLVTNDFNLNKVAAIQGTKVLNINDLANAVKAQLVVGEVIDVTIIRAGSERQQGVAYMPDGTMIVVEDTADKIDKTLPVQVAKVLQTSAGRMIFADLVKK